MWKQECLRSLGLVREGPCLTTTESRGMLRGIAERECLSERWPLRLRSRRQVWDTTSAGFSSSPPTTRQTFPTRPLGAMARLIREMTKPVRGEGCGEDDRRKRCYKRLNG